MAWTETAATKKKAKEPAVAPYLYTTKFNAQQDLLFCGGAGKNEMRVYDWESGSIVANISNLPKPITCGAQAANSSMFCFGAVDSRIRIFNIVNQASSSARDTQSQMSSVFSRKH